VLTFSQFALYGAMFWCVILPVVPSSLFQEMESTNVQFLHVDGKRCSMAMNAGL
jgi:predicted secreted protein